MERGSFRFTSFDERWSLQLMVMASCSLRLPRGILLDCDVFFSKTSKFSDLRIHVFFELIICMKTILKTLTTTVSVNYFKNIDHENTNDEFKELSKSVYRSVVSVLILFDFREAIQKATSGYATS